MGSACECPTSSESCIASNGVSMHPVGQGWGFFSGGGGAQSGGVVVMKGSSFPFCFSLIC